MKKVIFTFWFTLIFFFAFSQVIKTEWAHSGVYPKRFIENKGQFDGRNFNGSNQTLYAVHQGAMHIYFSKKGITYCIDKKEKNRDRKEGSHEPKVKYYREIIQAEWLGANKNTEIIPINKSNDYYSYSFYDDDQVVNINHISGYKKIVYKELYPKIDVEFVFHPVSGIKYSLILYPGADLSQVRIQYKTAHNNKKNESISIQLNQMGQIEINTPLGDIIEHKPFSFYANSKTEINSNYLFENNVLTFELDNYDKTQKVVIDPWVVSPAFATSTAVWEVETDGFGNVYVIGGETPMELKKYDSAGNLQWTYTTPWDTASVWLGTLATDSAGTSYITSGVSPEMERIDNAGNMIWHSNAGGGALGFSDELWSITFNCDNTKLIVGGTKGPPLFGFDYYAAIYDIDMSNGNVLDSVTLAYTDISVFGATPEEVRSISSSRNAKYIFLTHNQVGAINQILGVCPNDDPVFQVDNQHNLGYKCENYLPPNQNGGGLKALVANDNYFYTHAGDEIYRWSLNNGALLNSVALPGGGATTGFGGRVVHNSGLAVDDCGNVYAGSMSNVVKFDSALNILSQSTVSFTVYDVSVNNNGEVLAVGAQDDNSVTNRNGRIESINMSACAQYALVCCDAGICSVGPFCDTDSAITLTPSATSGTWTGTGITNSSNGTFDPSVAGAGTHTIVNTIGCGSDSITIIVSTCAALYVCIETNGDLTVSNGTGSYIWEEETTTQDCSGCIPPGNCGFPAGCEVNVTTWTTYSTSATATPPGTFPIQVTDNSSNTLLITTLAGIPSCSPCALTSTTSVTNALCNGSCDGTATANPSGGTSPYSYQWDSNAGSQTSQTASGLCAGTYSVTVNDNVGCADTLTVIINQPGALNVVASATNVSCNGGNDGIATVVVSGGASPYSYAWSNGQLTSSATGLIAGTYTITVTDNNSCTNTDVITVTEPTAIILSATSTDENCGASDGTATVTASGGTGPYTYLWSDSQTTSTAINLSAGNYTVTVTDNDNCSQSVSTSVNSIGGPTLSMQQTDITCNGLNDGSGLVTASGGATPYTYLWDDPLTQTTTLVTGLPAGTFNVTVTDSAGCASLSSIVIIEPSAIGLSLTSTPASCGLSDGSATVSASGGTGPFSYNWSPTGGTSATANSLAAGTYTVVVTDSLSCSTTDSISVINTGGPSASITSSADVSCFGGADGSATVTVSAGSGPYTYTWIPTGGTDSTDTGLSAGTYSVMVTDAGGCTSSDTIVINEPTPVSTVLSVTNASCNDACDWSITAIPSGGTGAYSYQWDDACAVTTQTFSATSCMCVDGTYSVIVQDNNGCADTVSATITDPPALTISTSSTPASCNSSDGSATAAVGGGTLPYTYIWSPTGQTTAIISGLAFGIYYVTVTDASGCTATDSATVSNSGGATASITATTNTTCFGYSDGSATVTAIGGTTPYTYSWNTNPIQSNAVANNLAAGTYTCTVTDSAGCVSFASATIIEPSEIIVTVSSDATVCIGDTIIISASATGGTLPYVYTWDNGLPNDSVHSVYPDTTTTYTVIVVDSNFCTASSAQTITITTSSPLSVTAGGTNTICIGDSTIITANANGGDGNYTYTWSNGGNVPVIWASPTSTISYTVIVTDGCGTPPASASVTITVTPELIITPPFDYICIGETATLYATGALSYWWKDINTLDTIVSGDVFIASPTVTTNYIIDAWDGVCLGSDTVTIYVANSIAADFSYDPEVATVFDPTFTFTDLSMPIVNAWQWTFGDGDSSIVQNPMHTYGDSGSYPVQLIVWDSGGCADTIVQYVLVKGIYTLFAPSSFTPNGDNINDYFMPKGIGVIGEDFEMLIYNRWGDMIGKVEGEFSNEPTIGWDGKANYGKKQAQEDVYVWLINTVEGEGRKHQYIGHVTLVR